MNDTDSKKPEPAIDAPPPDRFSTPPTFDVLSEEETAAELEREKKSGKVDY
ncbi:MAG: hypothetical protein ACR2H1_06555 [Limisphaerales bacterium]